jgi:erythromycin esterase
MPAYKPGFRRVSSVLLCLIAVSLAACTQATPPAKHNTLSSDLVVRWIQQNAIPLQTVNPNGSDTDLTPLQQIVGNADIVGLGEATHGTHEFFDIKSRLAKFLIARMSFTTFIMENDWDTSQLIDAYINGGGGNINDVMQAGLFGSWQTQEYRALLEWMRAYNANPAHTTKVHFLGMDCQGAGQSDFDAVENYLRKVDHRQVAYAQQLYEPIIAADLPNPFRAYVYLDSSAKQLYAAQAQQVYNLLQSHQQVYISHSSSQDFALALQNARIIVQATTYFNSNTQIESVDRYIQRDSFLAENVAWIHDHTAGSNPKIIVWAHDEHVANNPSYAPRYVQNAQNMGGYLRTWYKESYLPIGTTLYQGVFRTYHYPQTSTQQIPTPTSDTYNYTLGQASLPLYMLDLRKIPPGPVANWVGGYATLLNYGLGGENMSTSCTLNVWFNVIIHVQNTNPSNPL